MRWERKRGGEEKVGAEKRSGGGRSVEWGGEEREG